MSEHEWCVRVDSILEDAGVDIDAGMRIDEAREAYAEGETPESFAADLIEEYHA